MPQLLFHTAELLDILPVGKNIDAALFGPLAKSVETTYVIPALGEDFYDLLLSQVAAGTVTPANQLVLDRWLREAVAWKSYSDAVLQLSVELRQQGAIYQTGQHGQTASREDRIDLQRQTLAKANVYLRRTLLRIFEASQDYPEFNRSNGRYRPCTVQVPGGFYVVRKNPAWQYLPNHSGNFGPFGGWQFDLYYNAYCFS